MSTHANKASNSQRKTYKLQERPPFECIALLLQGGGALGAYQAGVYQALSEAHIHPDWVAGARFLGPGVCDVDHDRRDESRAYHRQAARSACGSDPQIVGAQRRERYFDTSV
jgi:hypothetical protein